MITAGPSGALTDDHVDLPRRDIVQQLLERRPLHRPARKAAVVIAFGERDSARGGDAGWRRHSKRDTAELPRVEWARRRSKSSRAPALPERDDPPRGARSPPRICRLTPRPRILRLKSPASLCPQNSVSRTTRWSWSSRSISSKALGRFLMPLQPHSAHDFVALGIDHEAEQQGDDPGRGKADQERNLRAVTRRRGCQAKASIVWPSASSAGPIALWRLAV